MPSYRNYSGRRRYTTSFYSRNRKYSNAETIAFKLGQEARVKNSLKSGNKDTRVYEAFARGYCGVPQHNKKKDLF